MGQALLSLFAYITGTSLMAIENLMGDELTEKEMEIQVCIPNLPNNNTNLGLVDSTESLTNINLKIKDKF